MIGTPLTPEEKEIAIRGLAKRVAIDDLIKMYPYVYQTLVEKHIRTIKGESENMAGADENDEA
jgi:hypothetical protein